MCQNWHIPLLYLQVHLFPFALLCVLQSISQFSIVLSPPRLQAVTWSASISDSFQMRVLLTLSPIAQYGQLLLCPSAIALSVCSLYFFFLISSLNILTLSRALFSSLPRTYSKIPLLLLPIKLSSSSSSMRARTSLVL